MKLRTDESVGAAICRPLRCNYDPCGQNGITSRYVIPTAASAEWRNPPHGRKNQHKIKLATREDSSTHIRSLGMTCREAGPFCPHRLYSKRGGRQIAAPTYATPLRLLFLQCGTWYRASSTAYGGPPSPKGKVMGVVPFIHTDSIRHVPGTAHRPFPTVSLNGGIFNRRIS